MSWRLTCCGDSIGYTRSLRGTGVPPGLRATILFVLRPEGCQEAKLYFRSAFAKNVDPTTRRSARPMTLGTMANSEEAYLARLLDEQVMDMPLPEGHDSEGQPLSFAR